jgi:hypothetical protein
MLGNFWIFEAWRAQFWAQLGTASNRPTGIDRILPKLAENENIS